MLCYILFLKNFVASNRMKKRKKIIVRMPNWLGDFVMALPVLKELKKRSAGASIYVICRKPLDSLIEGAPYIDGIIPFKKPRRFFSKATFDISKEIKKHDFDKGLLLTNSFSSAFYFYMAKIPFFMGYSSFLRNMIVTKKIKIKRKENKNKNIHQVESYQNLLNYFLNKKKGYLVPVLEIDQSQKDNYKNKLVSMGVDITRKIVCLNPHAAYGAAKCWPIEKYRELALKLIKDGFFIIVIGDSKALRYTKEVFPSMHENILNLAGKTTLKELAIVLDLSSFIITNDSGPMHLAAALKKPLIAIFGSTSPKHTGPYGTGTVVYKNVECSPCFKRRCTKDFKCMNDISAHEIYDLIKLEVN